MEIKDRVAVGDNRFKLKNLTTGEEILITLTPSPEQVQEEGTAINKELLQPIVDSVENLKPIQINTNDFIAENSSFIENLGTAVFKSGNVVSGILSIEGKFLLENADEFNQINLLKIAQSFVPKHLTQCVVFSDSDLLPRVRIDSAGYLILTLKNENIDNMVISFTYIF